MLKGLVVGLLAAVLAALLGPASAASALTPHEHTPTYAYDGQLVVEALNDTPTERGPRDLHYPAPERSRWSAPLDERP